MKSQSRAMVVVLVLVLGVVGVAGAAPFVNPPEANHPDWVTAFPYQRNILVGFDTDPHFWPDHISSPVPDARKALTPLVVHHEGTDDDVLYPSDWLGGDVQPPGSGYTGWLATDTVTGTNRERILMLSGQAGSTFTLVWNIDNWDRPWEEKHFYMEVEYHTTGNQGSDEVVSSTGQSEVLVAQGEELGDGWVRLRSWATLVPNPPYEQMINTVTFEQAGVVLIDYMHIATECVPEPGIVGLLVLGGVMLRRRK